MIEMTNIAEIFEMVPPSEAANLPSLEAIREELQRIVQSKTFHRAKRLRSLLEYVVTAATKGEASGESQTAREHFGKSVDFDPALDPVIRVQFGRLRRALANYYSDEGKRDAVNIKIPPRRYAPVFQETTSMSVNGHRNESRSDGASDSRGNGAMRAESNVENGRPSIAVLPFANLTSDPSQDAFCYGLTEEIANILAAVSSIDVVASSSSFQYKNEHVDVREVGRDLGVPLILEGSVRMEEGQTRVIAQLARSNDGVAIWSGSFDGKMNGSLETQKSIAQEVMNTLPLNAYEACA